jgi:hypothetical protein
MNIVPISFEEACIFIKNHHRHHKPPVGHKFSIACEVDGEILGVCVVGRPVSRHEDNGWTLEVTRMCADGTKNVCSKLYRTAWNVAKNLGYKKLITYILDSENGASVRAAGYALIGEAGGGSWSCKSRPRVDKHPTQRKLKFEIT